MGACGAVVGRTATTVEAVPARDALPNFVTALTLNVYLVPASSAVFIV
jgi:hypothetical protein